MQTAWNDYYPANDDPIEINTYSSLTFNSNSKTLSPTTGNSYVFNCYFSDMTTNGGAILYSALNCYLLVEKCTINNCKVTENTAGIRVTKGNCIITFTCGYNTKAEVNDAFSAVHSDANRKINSVFDSSISHCEAIN